MQGIEGATIIPDHAQRDFLLAMWRNLKYSSESDSGHKKRNTNFERVARQFFTEGGADGKEFRKLWMGRQQKLL